MELRPLIMPQATVGRARPQVRSRLSSGSTGKTTIKSIASSLGLAPSTVSMALQRHPEISVKTQTLVHATAREMNYSSNGIARAMVTGKTQVIGVLLGQGIHDYVGKMLGGILAEANDAEHFIKVFGECEADRLEQAMRQCLNQRVDAMICHHLGQQKTEYIQKELLQHDVPVVALEGCKGPLGGRVDTDNKGGVAQAVQHLAELGHRRIGCIARLSTTSMADRTQGFRDAIHRYGLEWDENLLVPGGSTDEETERDIAELLTRPDRPTGVFVMNDAQALLVQRIARAVGLRLPMDLSIVGFGNLPIAEWGDPRLTTVAQPWDQLGRQAVQLALEAIRLAPPERHSWRAERILPTTLVIRNSTAPCPRG